MAAGQFGAPDEHRTPEQVQEFIDNFRSVRAAYQKLEGQVKQKEEAWALRESDWQKQRRRAEDELRKWKDDAAAKQQEIDALRRELKGVLADNTEKVAVVKKYLAEIEELRPYVAWYQQGERRCQEMERERDLMSKTMNQVLHEKDAQYAAQIQHLEDERRDLLERLNDRSQEEQVATLQKQKRELEFRLEEMVKDLKDLREKTLSRSKGEQDMNRQLRQAAARARELEQELATEQERARQARQSYLEENASAQQLHTQVLAMHAKCQQAKEEADHARDELDRMRVAQLGELADVKQQHQKEVEELERDRVSLRDLASGAQFTIESERTKHQVQLQQLRLQGAEALREESERRQLLEQRAQELQSERARCVEKAEREKAQMREEKRELQQQVDVLRQQRQDLDGERAGLQLRMAQLEQQDKWRRDEMERFQLERMKEQERQGRLEASEEARVQAEEQAEMYKVRYIGAQQQLQALQQEKQTELAHQRDRQERALVAREQQMDEERQGYGYTIKALQLKLRSVKERSKRDKDRWMSSVAEQIKRCEELAARCEALEDENKDLRRTRGALDSAAQVLAFAPGLGPRPALGAAGQGEPPPVDAAAIWQRNKEKLDALQMGLEQQQQQRGARAEQPAQHPAARISQGS